MKCNSSLGNVCGVLLCLFALLIFSSPACAFHSISSGDGLEMGFDQQGLISFLKINEEILGPFNHSPFLGIVLRNEKNFFHNENLIQNGQFEDSIQGWNIEKISGEIRFFISSPGADSKGCLEIEGQGFLWLSSKAIHVTQGKSYNLGVMWKVPDGRLLSNHKTKGLPYSAMAIYRGHSSDSYKGINTLVNGIYGMWLDKNGKPIFSRPALLLAFTGLKKGWNPMKRLVVVPKGASALQLAIYSKLREKERIQIDKIYFSPFDDKNLVRFLLPSENNQKVSDNQLIQKFATPDFSIDLAIKGAESGILFEGNVTGLNSKEQAIDLVFSFPLGTDGWKFHYDLHHDFPTGEFISENSVSALSYGWLPVSLYPYVGISKNGQGIGLALPPYAPQYARFYYDGISKTLNAVFHLGVSPSSSKHPLKATFSLMVIGFNPSWGLRGLVYKYGQIFKTVMSSPITFSHFTQSEEIHPCQTKDGTIIPHVTEEEKKFYALYAASNYAIPLTPSDAEMPGLDEIQWQMSSQQLPYLEDQISMQQCRTDGLNPNLPEIIYSYINSMGLESVNSARIYSLSTPKWEPGYWCAEYSVNIDPDIQGGYGKWLLIRSIIPSLEYPIHAVRLDNLFNFTSIDMRQQAIMSTDFSLSYDPNLLKPGVPTAFSVWELIRNIRQLAGEQRYIGVGANDFGIGGSNYPGLDYYAFEGSCNEKGLGENWNEEILDYRRAMAMGRPLRFSNFSSDLKPEGASRFCALAMHYGIRIGINRFRIGTWPSETMKIFEKAQSILDNYVLVEWQPLTFISSSKKNCWIERFGTDIDSGIYITLFNHQEQDDTCPVEFSPDMLNMKKKQKYEVSEIGTSSVQKMIINSDAPLFSVKIRPWETKVFFVKAEERN